MDARVIFPVGHNKHRDEIARAISLDKEALQSTKKRAKGGKVQETVYCKADINEATRVHEHSIAYLLQVASRQPELLKDYSMDRMVDAHLPNVKAPKEKKEEQEKPGTFDIRLRTQPSIDCQKSLIHVEFDLVPCLPELSANQLLVRLFGTDKPTAELIEENLTALQYTLCGLRARCMYKPGKKHADNRASSTILAKGDKSGREIQIQDVQPHNVPEFELGNEKIKTKVVD